MGDRGATLILLLILCSILVTFPNVGIVKAEPTTIVVPDDYSTIQEAVYNANEGDRIFVKKGTYEEHSIAVNKTLTLSGEETSSTIIKNIDESYWDPVNPFPPPRPIVIKINANNVKISNFTITCEYGWWIPIDVNADSVLISGNILNKTNYVSLQGNNITFIQNSFRESLRDSFIGCFGSYNTISDNNLSGGSGGGISIGGSFNSVCRNTIDDEDHIDVQGNNNLILNNSLPKSIIESGGEGNVISGNIVAVLVASGFNNTFVGNEVSHGLSIIKNDDNTADHIFYHNNFVADPSLSITFSDWIRGEVFFDNGREGNYWSDYNGTDSDGDGIGDTPYIIGFNRKDNYPLMNPIDIYSIPEFPSWTPLLIMLVAVMIVAVIYKRRLRPQTN